MTSFKIGAVIAGFALFAVGGAQVVRTQRQVDPDPGVVRPSPAASSSMVHGASGYLIITTDAIRTHNPGYDPDGAGPSPPVVRACLITLGN